MKKVLIIVFVLLAILALAFIGIVLSDRQVVESDEPEVVEVEATEVEDDEVVEEAAE